MLADLLPELTAGATALQLELVPPPSWAIASGIKSSAGTYLVSAPDKAVFMIGPALRLNTRAVAGGKLLLALSGKWPFADSEIMNTAGRVVDECARVTGTVIPSDSVLMLLPSNGAAFTWTAETRGNAIVVLLNTAEPKRQLLARLGVILTHEAFHLWVPNALHFDGDYDWFFEGFTRYQALLTALRLRLIDFDEYLNTLARVYDSYLLAEERDRWSLLELSQRRWTSTSSLVYNKGMLVAMIYDLHLRQLSGGKRGLPSLYPQLLKAGDTRGDANEVIISLLDRPAGMNDFSSAYVSKAQALDFPALLSPYGITLTRSGFETKLSVKKPLERTQEAVLKSLRFKG
jgi:predicted metalloprotease with PDZ domain